MHVHVYVFVYMYIMLYTVYEYSCMLPPLPTCRQAAALLAGSEPRSEVSSSCSAASPQHSDCHTQPKALTLGKLLG